LKEINFENTRWKRLEILDASKNEIEEVTGLSSENTKRLMSLNLGKIFLSDSLNNNTEKKFGS
jgi:hypothetical protein